jgi:hypothetical protein
MLSPPAFGLLLLVTASPLLPTATAAEHDHDGFVIVPLVVDATSGNTSGVSVYYTLWRVFASSTNANLSAPTETETYGYYEWWVDGAFRWHHATVRTGPTCTTSLHDVPDNATCFASKFYDPSVKSAGACFHARDENSPTLASNDHAVACIELSRADLTGQGQSATFAAATISRAVVPPGLPLLVLLGLLMTAAAYSRKSGEFV